MWPVIVRFLNRTGQMRKRADSKKKTYNGLYLYLKVIVGADIKRGPAERIAYTKVICNL